MASETIKGKQLRKYELHRQAGVNPFVLIGLFYPDVLHESIRHLKFSFFLFFHDRGIYDPCQVLIIKS